MDIGSVLILVGVAVLAGAFVARPLIERQPAQASPGDVRASAVQAELDRVMATIQELDMDLAMEKVDVAQHQAQRSTLMTRGAALLRQRDELSGAPAAELQADPLEALVEAQIARLRVPAEASTAYCGHCGQPALAGDRFCVRCGAALATQETPA